MKLTLSFLSFIFLFVNSIYSQSYIGLSEDMPVVEICGQTLMLGGFFIDNYQIKVDIMVFDTPQSKPVIGSYTFGDTVSMLNTCKFPVVYMKKYAIKNPGGTELRFGSRVILARYPLNSHPEHGETFMMDSGDTQKFTDSITWVTKEVSMNSAHIELQKDTQTININLERNSIVWFGENAYYVSNFLAQATDDPSKAWLIEFTRVKDYSYLTGESIAGKDINSSIDFPSGDSWLIIRKMKYYSNKRVDEQELANTPVKYWVLQVYNYHGGIAKPVIEVNLNGEKRFLEYSAYKSFETEEEVLEFARINGVMDVVLEEE